MLINLIHVLIHCFSLWLKRDVVIHRSGNLYGFKYDKMFSLDVIDYQHPLSVFGASYRETLVHFFFGSITRSFMLCSTKAQAWIMKVQLWAPWKEGFTCLAGRRYCHSPSPHRGLSPAVWKVSGSLQPDPEAQRGECWQTLSMWWAKKDKETVNTTVQNHCESPKLWCGLLTIP